MSNRQERINEYVWYAIGHVGYKIGNWNYCAVKQYKDGKHNYYVDQWMKKAGDCVEYLKKNYPVKYVQSSYGRILFWIDDTKIIAKVDQEIADAEAKRVAELMAIDLKSYIPNQKVLDKLRGYFDKGSKVNLAAIKDGKKLLTYYYAFVLMNWGDMRYEIPCMWQWSHWKDENGAEFGKILDAIDERVVLDPALTVGRDRAEQRLLEYSKRLWKAAKDSGLPFDFKVVPTTYDECWKDRKNGCAWTVAYLLTVGDKSVRFSEVTNEGVDSPSFGWQTYPNGWDLMSKTQCENIVLSRLGLA